MNWVRHGSSATFETKSSYCRVKVEFNSINLARHGSSTTFETGLSFRRGIYFSRIEWTCSLCRLTRTNLHFSVFFLFCFFFKLSSWDDLVWKWWSLSPLCVFFPVCSMSVFVECVHWGSFIKIVKRPDWFLRAEVSNNAQEFGMNCWQSRELSLIFIALFFFLIWRSF